MTTATITTETTAPTASTAPIATTAPTETTTPTETAPTQTTTTTSHEARDDPRKSPWPDLTTHADEQAAVKKLIDAGQKQKALDLLITTLKKYCCNFGDIKGARYEPNDPSKGGIEGDADFDVTTKEVRLGNKAFKSVAWLYSSLKHELVHAAQWRTPKAAEKMTKEERDYEAYKREVANANNTGLSQDERKDVQQRCQDNSPLRTPDPACKPPRSVLSRAFGKRPSAARSTVGAPSGRLRFTISLRRAVFQARELIPLRMVLRNVGPKTVIVNKRLALNARAAALPFRDVFVRVKRPSGGEARFRLEIRIGVPEPADFVELRPRKSVERTTDIASRFLLDEPGKYEVTAFYKQDGTSQATRAKVKSNTLTFTLAR